MNVYEQNKIHFILLGELEKRHLRKVSKNAPLTKIQKSSFFVFSLLFLCSSYHFRIDPVSIPYCFRIVSVFRYGINTGSIRERQEDDRRSIGGRQEDEASKIEFCCGTKLWFIVIDYDYLIVNKYCSARFLPSIAVSF